MRYTTRSPPQEERTAGGRKLVRWAPFEQATGEERDRQREPHLAATVQRGRTAAGQQVEQRGERQCRHLVAADAAVGLHRHARQQLLEAERTRRRAAVSAAAARLPAARDPVAHVARRNATLTHYRHLGMGVEKTVREEYVAVRRRVVVCASRASFIRANSTVMVSGPSLTCPSVALRVVARSAGGWYTGQGKRRGLQCGPRTSAPNRMAQGRRTRASRVWGYCCPAHAARTEGLAD